MSLEENSIEEELVSTLIIMQIQVSKLEELEKRLPKKEFKNIKNLSRLLVKGIIKNFEETIKNQWKCEDGEETSIELISLYENIANELAKSSLADLHFHLAGTQAINKKEFKFETNGQ